MTYEAEITLDASRNWFRQVVHWVAITALSIFDGSFMGSESPLDLVVRDRRTRKVVYKAGPCHGADAVQEAQEAARVIRVIGVGGYVNQVRL